MENIRKDLLERLSKLIVNNWQPDRVGCSVFVVSAKTRKGLIGAQPRFDEILVAGSETDSAKFRIYKFNAQEKVYRTTCSPFPTSREADRCPELGRLAGGLVFQAVNGIWWGIGVSGFSEEFDELFGAVLAVLLGLMSNQQVLEVYKNSFSIRVFVDLMEEGQKALA